MTDRELNGLRSQVCQSMVPLLLHLKDQCPAVVTVSVNLQAFHLGQRDRAARPGCLRVEQKVVAGEPGTHRPPQIPVLFPCTPICGQPDLWGLPAIAEHGRTRTHRVPDDTQTYLLGALLTALLHSLDSLS